MKNGSCSATTVAGSAALPFVISTGAPKERSGEICGFSGPFLEKLTQRDEKRVLVSNYCRGSAALPFVISTGAPKERSGEICGFSGSFLEKLTQRDEKRVLFSNYCRWERRPPLCHLDRSS